MYTEQKGLIRDLTMYTEQHVDKEDMRFCRTIALNKDGYISDAKHIIETDVLNSLEIVGFSYSNQCYVVHQDKVASLISLKEITQLVQYLDEGLVGLDEVKEELINYQQQLDKQRKSLEYITNDKELQDGQPKSLEVAEACSKVSEAPAKMDNKVFNAHEEDEDLDQVLEDLTKEVQVLNKETEAAKKRRMEATKQQIEVDLDVEDMQEGIYGDLQAKEQKLQEEIYRLNADLNEHDVYTKSCGNEVATLDCLMFQSTEGFNSHKAQREKLQDERKSLWKKETKLAADIYKLRQEVEKAEKDQATPCVEDSWSKVSERSSKTYNEMLNAHEKFRDLEKVLKDHKKAAHFLNKEKEEVEKFQTEAVKREAEPELDVKNLQNIVSENFQDNDDASRQLDIVQKEIEDSLEEFDKTRPLHENKGTEAEIMECEKQLSILQKQVQAIQFSSKAAHNKWLEKQIDDIRHVLSSNLSQEHKLQEEIYLLNSDLREQDPYIESNRNEIVTLDYLVFQSHEEFNSHKAQRDQLPDEQKSLWEKVSDLGAEIDQLRLEVEKAVNDHATLGGLRIICRAGMNEFNEPVLPAANVAIQGIQNVHRTCFLSVVLWTFSVANSFRMALDEFDDRHTYQNSICVASLLRYSISEIRRNTAAAFNPILWIRMMNVFIGDYAYGSAQDARALLQAILLKLHDCGLAVWNLVGWPCTIQGTCLACKAPLTEHWVELGLRLRACPGRSLQESFQEFCTRRGKICDYCHSEEVDWIRSYNGVPDTALFLVDSDQLKVGDLIQSTELHITDLSKVEHQLSLRAICFRVPRGDEFHYFACVQIGTQWYHCDDMNVQEVNLSSIGDTFSDGFILLFEKEKYVQETTCKRQRLQKDLAVLEHNEEALTSLDAKVAKLEEDLCKSRQDFCCQLEKKTKIISDLLISVSKSERQVAQMKVRQDSIRLGIGCVIRAGTAMSETWEDAQWLKDLNIRLKQLSEEKEAVEQHRKSLQERQSDKSDGADAELGVPEAEFLIEDDIFKSRLASIKREKAIIMHQRDRYELEKGQLMREMQRMLDENSSRFNNFKILNQRYVLLNLLGKGGFGEVYKAYDLEEHRYVACKLHGLNAQWSKDRKESYLQDLSQEYNIHKNLVHRHIVRLWDYLKIDDNTFCTVLEYCSGKDLDAVLTATPVLPEKEARVTIVQIFLGLVYLNKRAQKIIHCDLKPGNVLFDEFGIAKITDFGLSKKVEEDVGSQGISLTLRGAGTYWYLPPECFERHKTPFISSKVDVWSAGVIFYQMLFGRRPFGHDLTQDQIFHRDTIIKARKVEFPSMPRVSNEAKDFIRRCLTHNQAERPDVLTIAREQYLSHTKTKQYLSKACTKKK